jgi:magnesium chelatase family protein
VLARAATFALLGVDAIEVAVEADIHAGLPAFTIVGLPDTAVQESRERVRAAIVNCGFEFPLRRITVNLAPADLRKAGPAFDLALASALLAAAGQLPGEALSGYAIAGELGLDGTARPVRGVLAMADACRRAGRRGLVVPGGNAAEASLVAGLDVIPVDSLADLAGLLSGRLERQAVPVDPQSLLARAPAGDEDLSQVRGQHGLKRALAIAAAGGHNLLMVGPPGSGKSMAARRLPSIMPPLTVSEALEVTKVHSAAGLLRGEPLVSRRPFRAPHHSISGPGLVGGGSTPAPGEASFAQHGVLFLDELAEFSRPALEALRQPLEEGCVRITRAQRAVTFPARFMLVAATNPCPCGHAGDPRRPCSCPAPALQRYEAKLSGPLVDRVDMIARVDPPTREEVMSDRATQGSAELRERVVAARARQADRLGGARCNADMSAAEARSLCRLDRGGRATLYAAHERVGLTVRGHDRVLRVARTLADLEGREAIARADVAQAVAYRDFRTSERPAVTVASA